jgi:exodeoxyribonuclease V alpha subunit
VAGPILGPGGARRDELLSRSTLPAGDLDLDVLGAARPAVPRGRRGPAGAAAVCAAGAGERAGRRTRDGKTTTVSRLLALLREQHPEWRIALAAPTGKAGRPAGGGVRLVDGDAPADDRERLGELSATTLHRLLGWRPEARTRFRTTGRTGCRTRSSSSTRARWCR